MVGSNTSERFLLRSQGVSCLDSGRSPRAEIRRTVRSLLLIIFLTAILIPDNNSHTHDVLTDFLVKEGFQVTKNFCLPTAWEAKFTHGSAGRTIGVNSEMDALPGVGHACGHNLIAIAGVAVACALKDVLQEWNISGKIILLGTPGRSGRVMLLGKIFS